MEDINSVRRLTKIFKSKDWFSKDSDEYVFDSFCDLLGVLDATERELLLELTDRYLWISGKEYEDEIKEVLNQVPAGDLANISKLYLFPVIKPTDEGKAKSGISLVYDVKSMLNRIPRFLKIAPVVLDTFEDFDKAPGSKDKELICFIDDFIGSGDTLYQCFEEIEKRMKLDCSKIFIATISCQKDTYDGLTAKGIKVYCKHQINKGITDFNEPPHIEDKKTLMRTIEKNIPGAVSFSLGWQESEAVITLKRTPDNTFPIFWKKIKRQGVLKGGPFLRD